MEELTQLLEYRETAVAVLALVVVYKILVFRFPWIDSGHRKQSADAMEQAADSLVLISNQLAEVIKIMAATNIVVGRVYESQRILEVAHTDMFARRPNSTYRWHNDPDREREIHETNETVQEIKRIVAQLREAEGGT